MRSLLVLSFVVLTACASDSPRVVVGDQEAIESELGFLRDVDTDRGMVLARLGPPTALFEGGRVVSYTVFFDLRTRRLSLSETLGGCFGLMIEYSPVGRIARHALVHHGSAQCPKKDVQ